VEIRIRQARLSDAPALLEIYSYYVLHTAITFECRVPSPEEFARRMEKIMERHPYFVAEEGGAVLGYAYAGPFVGREAYDWSAELTVYLRREVQGQGLGRRLYEALEEALGKMGVLNLYACIGLPEENDEYLTDNSARFHRHMGFCTVGTFRRCGYKFGRWYHMIWMEKLIGEHQAPQPSLRSWPEICGS